MQKRSFVVYKFKFNQCPVVVFAELTILYQRPNQFLDWSLNDQANIYTEGQRENQVEGHFWKWGVKQQGDFAKQDRNQQLGAINPWVSSSLRSPK